MQSKRLGTKLPHNNYSMRTATLWIAGLVNCIFHEHHSSLHFPLLSYFYLLGDEKEFERGRHGKRTNGGWQGVAAAMSLCMTISPTKHEIRTYVRVSAPP